MEKRSIYGLYDPRRPETVMCVGETKQGLSQRLSGYVCDARRGKPCPSMDWIRRLLSKGIRPSIRVLATTDDRNWKRCERRFITIWRKRNPDLLNVHRGGNGRENGEPPKLVCACGIKRRKAPCGMRYCPKCRVAYHREYRRTPKYQTWQRTYRRTPKRRAYNSKYSRTAKRRAYDREYRRKWLRTAKGRAYQRAQRKTERYRAYHCGYERSEKGRAWRRQWRSNRFT